MSELRNWIEERNKDFDEALFQKVEKAIAGHSVSLRKWLKTEGVEFSDEVEATLKAMGYLAKISYLEICAIRDESANWDSYYCDIIAEYLNVGETYEPTVIYDVEECEYLISSVGDYVENYQIEKGELL